MRIRTLAVAALVFTPALAAAQPYAYVSTPAADGVTAFDLGTNTVAGTVPLSGLPSGCALGRSGSRLYAALTESNALAIVDVPQASIRTVPVGSRPSGVAVGPGGRVYVANTASDTVSVVDPVAGAVVATIAVGDGPTAIVAGGRRVYVANWNGRSVSVIDTATASVAATIPVGTFPAGLALHADSGRLYVANFYDNTVSIVDTARLLVTSTVPVARGPRGLAVDAAGARLFVASFDESLVQVIDTVAGTVSLEAASGGQNPLDLMLDRGGSRLYVAHVQDTAGVVALDAATLAPLASVAVPAGPLAFAGPFLTAPPFPPLRAWRSARGTSAAAPGAAAGLAPAETLGAPRHPFDFDIVISDGEFAFGDWQGDTIATQETTGGNPGAWRRMQHFGSAVEGAHYLVRSGSSYTPSQAGPILSLDVSWDRRVLTEAAVFEAAAVTQNGVTYRTTERSFFSFAWQSDGRTGLVAADFADVEGLHPDFGGTGGRLFFGYYRRTLSGQSVQHGIDNFQVTIHSGGSTAAGRLGFETTAGVVRENDLTAFNVQRLNSAIGAVTVDMTRYDPNPQITTFDWPDGDSGDRGFYATGPVGNTARTYRYILSNPTGGAQIDPTRDSMVITVYPDTWSGALVALFVRLGPLLSGFSPLWLLALAGPAVMAARRSWRT